MATIFPTSPAPQVNGEHQGYRYNGTTWEIIGIDLTADYQPRVASVSDTEIGYLDGVTSAIQTQLGTKAPLDSPTFTGTVVLPSTTSIGNVTSTELGYVDGVTSSIQTQLGAQTTALSNHEADTTSIHGITDTSKLPNIASASAGRTIFVQAATPTAIAVGDIWFQVTGL